MKRGGDIVCLFHKEAMRIGKKKKAGNMPDVAEEQTGELVCVPVTIEEQTEEPTLSMSSVTIEQTEDVSPALPPVYDFSRLKHDPGERIPIASYPVNDQDAVRRAYILKKPFKPYAHDFEKRSIGSRERSLNPLWLHNHSWLEYSIKKESAFCFVCYLFKEKKTSGKGTNAFTDGGWRNWNSEDALLKRVGCVTSVHNVAQERYNLFVNPHAAIDNLVVRMNSDDMHLYKMR
ncbi:hypothetical protein ZWY2020_020063 [Hordeum vulgare]|nr:hypothetical protein ZWY2020_020063 [Hordeum vulgare]